MVTQSRMASLIASFSVRLPLGHAHDFRAQQPHAKNIQALPAHVLFAHVDDAFQAKEGAHRSGRHAMLAGAGFGDDAFLAHAPREQGLPQAVVDLVRAGVEQILALDVDLRAACISLRRSA